MPGCNATINACASIRSAKHGQHVAREHADFARLEQHDAPRAVAAPMQDAPQSDADTGEATIPTSGSQRESDNIHGATTETSVI